MRLNKFQAAEWKKCKVDPIYFITKYISIKHPARGKIPFDLYDWQKELIEYLINDLNVIILKSRQVGASWSVGAYIIWLITFHSNVECQLFSIGERQAINLLRKIKFMYRSLPHWLKHTVVENNKKRMAVSITKLDATTGERIVTSISSIDSYPSSADSGRGESPNFVFFDEHAAQPNDSELWSAVYPALQHGGQCASCSTPKGYDCEFARLWEDVERGMLNGWKAMRVHYTDCGFGEDWIDKVGVGMTPAQIRQEFELEFMQGNNPVFSAVDLASCYRPLEHPRGRKGLILEWAKMYAIAGGKKVFEGEGRLTREQFDAEYTQLLDTINATREFYTGVDTSEGKGKDQNSITTLNEYGVQIACDHNNLTLPQWAGYTDEGGQEHLGFVARWHEQYPGLMTIEENGPGMTVYNRVKFIDTTNSIRTKRAADNIHRTGLKTRIINDLVLAFAGRQIIITDPVTYEQLLAYQKNEKTGKMGAPKGRKDDAVMSLAWAYYTLKLHGLRTFEGVPAQTGGHRIFTGHIQDLIRANPIEAHAGGFSAAPMADLGVADFDYDFSLERVRSLK